MMAAWSWSCGSTTPVATVAVPPSAQLEAPRIVALRSSESPIFPIVRRDEHGNVVAVVGGVHRVRVDGDRVVGALNMASTTEIEEVHRCGSRWLFVSDRVVEASDFVGDVAPFTSMNQVLSVEVLSQNQAVIYGMNEVVIADCMDATRIRRLDIAGAHATDVRRVAAHDNVVVAVLGGGAAFGSVDFGETWQRVRTPNSYAVDVETVPRHGIVLTTMLGRQSLVVRGGQLALSPVLNESGSESDSESDDDVVLTEREQRAIDDANFRADPNPEYLIDAHRRFYSVDANNEDDELQFDIVVADEERDLRRASLQPYEFPRVIFWGPRRFLEVRRASGWHATQFDLARGHEFEPLTGLWAEGDEALLFDASGRYILIGDSRAQQAEPEGPQRIRLRDAVDGSEVALDTDELVDRGQAFLAGGRLLFQQRQSHAWATATMRSPHATPLPDALRDLDWAWLAPDGTVFGVDVSASAAPNSLLRLRFVDGREEITRSALPSPQAVPAFLDADLGGAIDEHLQRAWTTIDGGQHWVQTSTAPSVDAVHAGQYDEVSRFALQCSPIMCQFPIGARVWLERPVEGTPLQWARALMRPVDPSRLTTSSKRIHERERTTLVCRPSNPRTQLTTNLYTVEENNAMPPVAVETLSADAGTRLSWLTIDASGLAEHTTAWIRNRRDQQRIAAALGNLPMFYPSRDGYRIISDAAGDLFVSIEGGVYEIPSPERRPNGIQPGPGRVYSRATWNALDGSVFAFRSNHDGSCDAFAFDGAHGFVPRVRVGPSSAELAELGGSPVFVSPFEWVYDVTLSRARAVSVYASDRDGPLPPTYVSGDFDSLGFCDGTVVPAGALHFHSSNPVDFRDAEYVFDEAEVVVEVSNNASCIRAAEGRNWFATSDGHGHLRGTYATLVAGPAGGQSKAFEVQDVECEARAGDPQTER